MQKIHLPQVTLYGADTIDVNRLLLAFSICEKYADFGAKKIFTKTDKDYVTESGIQIINTDKISSLRDYNQFNLKHLNDFIDTDFVMVAEHDGFILNPDAWSDEFLRYDYIGAPWEIDDKFVVGNGGFSIRSKKLLKLVQSDPAINLDIEKGRYGENEDWVIGVVMREYLEKNGIRFAPVELAKQFSFEANKVLGVEWTNQFGFHGLKWTDISRWLKDNPEYKIDNPLDSWALSVKAKFKL